MGAEKENEREKKKWELFVINQWVEELEDMPIEKIEI